MYAYISIKLMVFTLLSSRCLNQGLIVRYPFNFRQSCCPVQLCCMTIPGCHFFNGLRRTVNAAVLPSLHPENFHNKPLATGSAEQGPAQPLHGKRGQIRVGIIRDGGKIKRSISEVL